MHSARGMRIAGMLILCVAIAVGQVYCQGTGSVVAFFEVTSRGGGDNADVDIYAQAVTPDGNLVWRGGKESLPVATSPQIERSPAACEDGVGGSIVVFEVHFIAGEYKGEVDLFAQRLDSQGNALWNEGKAPQPVATSKGRESNPVIISDGQGGAFIAYEWRDEEGDSDILAQRINANGELVWNEGKLPAIVGASEGLERSPVMVPDGQGGIIVAFEWEGDGGNVDVMAQRVSADGEVLWNEGKRAVDVASAPALERHVVAVPDGQGGALLAFELEFRTGEYRGDVDIVAQRISPEGTLLWHDGERSTIVSSGKGLERSPIVVPDGAGGMIVAFEYEFTEGDNAGDIDILAQRVNAAGERMWNNGERSTVVSAAKGLERAVQAVSTADGGAIFVFEHEFVGGEYQADVDVVAQRLSPDGERMWNAGERSSLVAASKWLERQPIPLPDGRDGAVVIYPAEGTQGQWKGDLDIEAVRISGEGELLWHDAERATDMASGKAIERNPAAVRVR